MTALRLRPLVDADAAPLLRFELENRAFFELVRFGHSRRSFLLGGQWFDRLLFERHRDAIRTRADAAQIASSPTAS